MEGSVTPGVALAIAESVHVVIWPWEICEGSFPLSLRCERTPGMLYATICEEIASGMFRRLGLDEATLGDRYASDAPMLMVPVSASEIPVPDPVPAVWMVTLEYFCEYPPAQRLK